ncbi:hypothetical protein H5410_026626 [Solanum commersonii]|uniref:CCHC-type domain-containing protein n=1 Tax=Solanum commersonii TaxID=4109 RepID=A0A9J5Z218_SOLCO|nr:hypothetical protein H5410_026626 [Solanum commersonii]
MVKFHKRIILMLKMDKLKERSQLGDFCAQFSLPDTSADSNKKKYRDSKYSNPDKTYRKKRSRYRSKEERDARKTFRKSNRFIKNRSKPNLAKIKCYRCGNFGHIAPNCKLEKLKTLELDERVNDKIYSFLYTSGFESGYDSDSGSEEEVDLLDFSDDNQHDKMNIYNFYHGDICSCENDEFYKLKYQFQDLNINTITSDNVIELLNEVIDSNLREKIIHLAVNNNASSSSSKNLEKQKNDFEFEYAAPYSMSEINNILNKQTTPTRDSSFDDLKNEIENLKMRLNILNKIK